MKRIVLATLALFLGLGAVVSAQNKVSGRVTDENGDPLPGVGVIVDGTRIGTSTDINGRYSVGVPSSAKTLSFSFIGMSDLKVAISGQSEINVVMKPDANYLEEIVVVGYGVQKKAHLTGSVVAVGSTELQKTTVSNVSQALVGKLPGLITQQSLGQPGSDQVSILVRGYSSYNDSGTVLVLVDGVQRDMNTVNPADIESISVLKDAASCAVYGMKGANGVILVTTKRGSEGSAQVSYNGRYVLSSPTAYPRMLTGTEYMQYYNIGYALDGNSEPFFPAEIIAATCNGDPSDGLENTDWTEPLRRTTQMHQDNVTVSGGNNKANYFISGGWQSQEGFIQGHSNKRLNVRSNVDIKATKNLTVSLNLGIMNQNYHSPGILSYANATIGGTVPFCLTSALPFIPKEFGGIPTSPMRTRGAFVENAEYGADQAGYSHSETFNVETSFKIEYAVPFVKGLKASMFVSWDRKDLSSKTFNHSYYVNAIEFADLRNPAFIENPSAYYKLTKSTNGLDEGNLYEGEQKVESLMLRPQLSYNRKFGRHDVGALFLYEQNGIDSHVFYASKQKFDLFDIQELGKATVVKDPSAISGSSGKSRYAGYVGRLNYAFDDKYLVEFAARYDGSYHFVKEHRWGFFPSVSAGWVISKEPFFKRALPRVDMLKLRASVGEVGNDNVAEYLYRKNYSLGTSAVAFGQTPQSALYNQTSYPREDLTWERIRTYDAGFEFSAWKGLLSAEFDWFYKYTYDILCNITSQYAPSLGGHYPTTMNMGEFDSRGFELSLRHQNHVGELNYSLSGNLSWAHNRIVKRTEAENTLPWQSVIGRSYGDVMGYVSDGLFQSLEEIENSALPLGAIPGKTVREGDIKYVDLNGDGFIDANDMTWIGHSSRPEMMFAFQADASWKGFDLSVQFQGAAISNKMLLGSWSNGVSDATPMTRPWYANYDNAPLYLVEQSWTPQNTQATYPRLSVSSASYANNYRVSDFWMRNGSYLRLKNVTLGYKLPSNITRKLNINKLRVFFTGGNLLTFTEFKYLDPESPNVVTGYYPQQRTFTFGVDLAF
ncbi:MAG: TonB-dependent receptor [Candidatus Cryptobacteroides sp.]|nr:TonB-dependent receptor [Candidatus Cryptobacteroides sp.]